MESDSQQQNSLIENGAKVSIFGETQEEVDTALAQLKGTLSGGRGIRIRFQTLHQEMLLWQQLERLHRSTEDWMS